MSSPSAIVRYYSQSWKKVPYTGDDEEPVQGKIVVITGCNAGIGEIVAFEMAKRGAVLVMACRDVPKAEKVAENIKAKYPESKIEVLSLDLGDLFSVRQCAEQIKTKFDHIDILINNAGVLFADGKMRKTKDGFEVHMGINHLGHFLFTDLLLDWVKKGTSSRIVTTSSGLFEDAKLDLDDLMLEKSKKLAPRLPYCNSKLANLYFTRALAKKLEGTGVTTYAICPGLVNTEMANAAHNGWLRKKIIGVIALTPEQGAQTILFCSLSKKCAKESGQMYRFCKPYECMKNLDSGVEEKLWEQSRVLVGLS